LSFVVQEIYYVRFTYIPLPLSRHWDAKLTEKLAWPCKNEWTLHFSNSCLSFLLYRYINNSLHLARKYARIVFRERSSKKTVSFEEQIMSKDKYPSIFSQPNWGYCVYYPSVLKIGEYRRIFPSFSWGIFAHVTRLDQ